ncbi:hypothetical protein PUN28_017180 [Cardiocondyla obscurior]|uniref:Uncharacterized protein n=1 Tax=Cardiocondyla obscurior TaxID=286306 RepID=A0AAW2ERH7_9HYME
MREHQTSPGPDIDDYTNRHQRLMLRNTFSLPPPLPPSLCSHEFPSARENRRHAKTARQNTAELMFKKKRKRNKRKKKKEHIRQNSGV